MLPVSNGVHFAKKVVYFSRVAKVADIVSVLRNNKHNGFPVSYYIFCNLVLLLDVLLFQKLC